MSSPRSAPEGLGGWLVLPLLGLLITPPRVALFLQQNFVAMWSDGTWTALTTPGGEFYHALWAPLLIGELVGNLLVIAFSLVALVAMVRKSWRTPALMMGFYAFSFVFVAADFMLSEQIPLVATQDDPESMRELLRAAVAAAIWIPYFRVSRRVRNTFVRPTPASGDPAPAILHSTVDTP